MTIIAIKINPTMAKNFAHLAEDRRFDWEILLITRSLLKRSRCSIKLVLVKKANLKKRIEIPK
jgi:hypothetical protein